MLSITLTMFAFSLLPLTARAAAVLFLLFQGRGKAVPAICRGMAYVHSPFAWAFIIVRGAAGMQERSKRQPLLCNLRRGPNTLGPEVPVTSGRFRRE